MWSRPKAGGVYKLDIIPNNCTIHAHYDKASGLVLRSIPIYRDTGQERSPAGFITPGDVFMVLSPDLVGRSVLGENYETDNVMVLFEELSGVIMLNVFRGCRRIT